MVHGTPHHILYPTANTYPDKSVPECSMAIVWNICLAVLSICVGLASCLHLTGTFSNKEFLKFLVKFGFQTTVDTQELSTPGYIYGNITPSTGEDLSPPYDMYLVVLDSDYFVDYYSYSDTSDKPSKCPSMFEKINTIAWDAYCPAANPVEDFMRRIPCPADGSLCIEERGSPDAVLKYQQFTFHIVDTVLPRFWYISLVACHRERSRKNCNLSFNSSIELSVDYNIWFVNGNPDSKHLNPFEHQFSFEMHDVWELYMTALVLNGFLLGVHVSFLRHQRHLLIYLITIILSLEVAGQLSNLVHISIFAVNGEGIPAFQVIGKFLDTCAQCVMMLELLLIAKGWAITTPTLNRKTVVLTIWTLYSIIYIVLFIVNLTSIRVIEDKDEWQTGPGYAILAFRLTIMCYFIYELILTARCANDKKTQEFFRKFAAGYLVWFVYLPIVALISPKITGLWRYKTLLGIQSGADFIFTLILVHLFWPKEGHSIFDIPVKESSSDSSYISLAQNRRPLISATEESSEDELYERQARINRCRTDRNKYNTEYTHTNGGYHRNNSIAAIDTTPL